MGQSRERVALEINRRLGGWLFPDRMEIRAHDLMPVPSTEWRTAMEEYIGLDVSMKETVVSIRREGKRVWRGVCASDPKIIANLIRKRAPAAKRVVFETGPLSVWFYHSLRAEGGRRPVPMRAMPKLRSIWRRTKPARTTPTVGRIIWHPNQARAAAILPPPRQPEAFPRLHRSRRCSAR